MKKKATLFNYALKILMAIISFSPKIVLNTIWNILDSSEGKLAILFRYLYLKKYCENVEGLIYVGKNTNLKNIHNLKLGGNISIHSFTYIDAHGGISIGDNVSIANHCTLIASDHTWSDENKPIKYNNIQVKPIVIESDVWIAAGVRVLGNVRIESRTVVGAGAVVNKSLNKNSLYVGVPAKFIKNLN